MALDLGFDEGGSGDTLLVSMQFGGLVLAREMKKKWKRRLKQDGLEYFHSVDFDNMSKGCFSGLDRKQRLRLLDDLSTYSHVHLKNGFTARISLELYNRETTNDFRSQWGTAYSFAIQMLMLMVHLKANEDDLANLDWGAWPFPNKPRVNVIIENGHRHSAQALEILQAAITKNDDPGQFLHVLTASLGQKKDHPILQASDMLAYGRWQYLSGVAEKPIYHAMHYPEVKTKYQAGFVDLNEQLVSMVRDGVLANLRRRKEYGRKIAEQYEARAKGI